MIGGRSLVNVMRNMNGSTWKIMNSQKIWYSSTISASRSIISTKSPISWNASAHLNRFGVFTDFNIMNRRFSSHGSDKNSNSSSKMSMKAKFLAGLGAIIAVGSGAIYHALVDQSSIFRGYYLAHCEGEDKKSCVIKQCDDSPCLRKNECEEENIIKANSDLEKALKDVKSKAIEYTEAAMKAYCEAIELMRDFLNNGYCLLSNDTMETPEYEESWCCIYGIAKKRCEKVKEAIEKGQCAWELLCRLRKLIEEGKACRYTNCNPLLVTAEEALVCAEKELLALKAKMDSVSTDHEMVEQYASVIGTFKSDLKSDVGSLVQECGVKYAEQETALMINEGYKKALRVQKEMAQVLVCTGSVPERFRQTMC